METVRRCISGRHTLREIRWHLAIIVVVFWGLVLCARMGYETGREYSIHKQMLSALGSFDERHNPEWFWVFTLAMVFCGTALVPVIFYVHHRFRVISEWGARVGMYLFLAGCAGIAFTGVFPDAHYKFFGAIGSNKIHVFCASWIIIGFFFGMVWHGVLLLKDKFNERNFATNGKTAYWRFIGPYLVCAAVVGTVLARVQWEYVFNALQALLSASREQAAEYWDNALQRLDHFPLLEHLAIWALTIYIVWFTALLPHRPGRRDEQEPSHTMETASD